MRQLQSFIWLHPEDCNPPHSLDLKSMHDYDKVDGLVTAFKTDGFNINMPALVGYVGYDGRVQLLSGTHRHLAAQIAGIMIPVTLWLRSDVEATWGTELWGLVIEDIPVRALEEWDVPDGIRESTHIRVESFNGTKWVSNK